MANIFGGGRSSSSLGASVPAGASPSHQTQAFSPSSNNTSSGSGASTNVFGSRSAGSLCNDSGARRVLSTSPEALQGSQTQTFTSSPNVFSKGDNFGESANLRDFYTKSEVQKLLRLKADISAVYSEEEVDELLADLRADINLDLAGFITEAEVDQKISDSYGDVLEYLGINYYTRAVLYTKTQVDNLIAGVVGVSADDFVLKNPGSTLSNTINPGSNNAVPLTLIASSNSNVTTVQHWVDSQSNSIGRVRNSGRVEFYGYMSLGENIESWRPALDVNVRRISGVADPIHTLDAVNKKYMEDFVVEVVDDIQRGEDGVYNIDCLTY
jgi:hypothetical protein